VQNWRTEV